MLLSSYEPKVMACDSVSNASKQIVNLPRTSFFVEAKPKTQIKPVLSVKVHNRRAGFAVSREAVLYVHITLVTPSVSVITRNNAMRL